MAIDNLVRKDIRDLVPYQSARKIGGSGDIWLNANESPYFNRFYLTDTLLLNRYPECQPKELVSAYASYVQLSLNKILVTRGSDEAIELLIKTFCKPNCDSIIFCPPTYDMYQVSSEIIGVKSIQVPLLDNFQLDIAKIVRYIGRFKLIYICNPNNPTGTLINVDDIIYLLEVALNNSLVVIDEAYIEFCAKYSVVSLLNKYSNLVILRTLSKAFSLAGLRCGFVLSNPKIIKFLLKVINPYPIALPVSDIAIQSLSKSNITVMKKRVVTLNTNRLWLVNQLSKIPIIQVVFKSSANYILVRCLDSYVILQELLKNKIVVRDQSKKLNLKDCIRISIGNKFECSRVIQVIKNLKN